MKRYEQACAIARAGAAHFVLDDEERLGCMATKLATEFGGRDAEVTRRIDATFRVVEDSLAGCVEAAQRNGDLDPGADPRAIARLIHATGRGLDVMARTGRGAAELDAIAESALASLPFPPPAPGPAGGRQPRPCHVPVPLAAQVHSARQANQASGQGGHPRVHHRQLPRAPR